MLEIDNLVNNLIKALSSEHTSYASTKKYLANLPTEGKYVIQGPGENAGILDLGGDLALALRIESHNHPSFIKPYQGAETGVGGILRDIFTMGARPIGTLDILRFGTDAYSQSLIEPVVKGISNYGNCVGVPVVGGEIYFDETFNHNCLINVAAFGLVKKKQIIYGNALIAGSDLIYVGARTGRDGIGGAQMSSTNLDILDKESVQEGDPFLEKLLLESCLELAETDYIEGMQDMGAAGLLCSTTEVILRGRKKTRLNLGALVDLRKIPSKAEGLTALEMMLSESQERMLIVGRRNYQEKILDIFRKWDLEALVVGEVTNDGLYKMVFEDNGVKEVSAGIDQINGDFNQDWPLKHWILQQSLYQKASDDLIKSTWQQYDWMVGTRTLKGPNQAGKYAVLDLPEIGQELVVSWSSDEGLSNIDAKKGVEFAFDKCYKRLLDQNATPLGLTNCLNFGHPEDSMGSFVQTVEALSSRCQQYGVPVVSGNVSLYNAYQDHSIKPTPVIVMVGLR